jgi:diguanylate cyclase (GGDEF)-like protein/PAS domain S-box-containing protein
MRRLYASSSGSASAAGCQNVPDAFDSRTLICDGRFVSGEVTSLTQKSHSAMRRLRSLGQGRFRRDDDVAELTQTRALLDAALDHAPLVFYAKDGDGRFTVVNTEFERIAGLPRAEIVGLTGEDLAPGAGGLRFSAHADVAIESGGTELFEEVVDGRTYVSLRFPLTAADGRILGVGGISTDVTARHRAEERFRRAFEAAPIGMALMSLDGRFLRVNPALCAITGYEASALEATSDEAITHPDDLACSPRGRWESIEDDGTGFVCDKRYITASGHTVSVQMNVAVVRDALGRPDHLLAQVQDVTERKRFEEQLQYMADHDPLTGLLNRRCFELEVGRHLAHVARYGASGALLVLDIDHFKTINDSLGHNAGDELIIGVAGVLLQRLRRTDAVARLGGDEFAVLVPMADEDEAKSLGESLLDDVRESTAQLDGHRRHAITMSLGVAMFDGTAVTPEDMIVNADLAMYDAKEAGRDRLVMYAAADHRHSRAKARLTWVERMDRALKDDGYLLEAQPIRDLATGEISQYELLIRMRGLDGDVIPPAAFLYVAERFGMIGGIDAWVAGQAIDLIAEHRRAGNALRLEVNLSARSLGDPKLLAAIEDRLQRTGIDPGQLIFEITETAAVASFAQARGFADRLRELGCGFALDDFGAGFGSFYYLKHLPFDYLKIDGEFVVNCTRNVTDRLIIAAVVEIARGMGKKTIAEFVTDEATQGIVESLGVDHAQGGFVGDPGPLAAVGAAGTRAKAKGRR